MICIGLQLHVKFLSACSFLIASQVLDHRTWVSGVRPEVLLSLLLILMTAITTVLRLPLALLPACFFSPAPSPFLLQDLADAPRFSVIQQKVPPLTIAAACTSASLTLIARLLISSAAKLLSVRTTPSPQLSSLPCSRHSVGKSSPCRTQLPPLPPPSIAVTCACRTRIAERLERAVAQVAQKQFYCCRLCLGGCPVLTRTSAQPPPRPHTRHKLMGQKTPRSRTVAQIHVRKCC